MINDKGLESIPDDISELFVDIELSKEKPRVLLMGCSVGTTYLIKYVNEMDAKEKAYASYLSQGRIDRPHFRTLEKINKKSRYK